MIWGHICKNFKTVSSTPKKKSLCCLGKQGVCGPSRGGVWGPSQGFSLPWEKNSELLSTQPSLPKPRPWATTSSPTFVTVLIITNQPFSLPQSGNFLHRQLLWAGLSSLNPTLSLTCNPADGKAMVSVSAAAASDSFQPCGWGWERAERLLGGPDGFLALCWDKPPFSDRLFLSPWRKKKDIYLSGPKFTTFDIKTVLGC